MKHQGQKLKGYIRDNGWAFTKASKELNISLEELRSYFENAYLDEETFRHVCSTLILYQISAEPFSISVEAMAQLKLLEGLVKNSSALITESAEAMKMQMDEHSRLKNIIAQQHEIINSYMEMCAEDSFKIKRLQSLKNPSFFGYLKRYLQFNKNLK